MVSPVVGGVGEMVTFTLLGLDPSPALLTLAGLVVLEPVEDVLPFDLAEPPELGGDVLDLVGGGGARPPPV